MMHGDDHGLRLPPKLAPIQAVIVPIWRTEEDRTGVMQYAQEMLEMLRGRVRVSLDDREQRPGWKFHEWEIRGVPVRVEIGPRDVEADTVVLVRRDTGEKVTVARGSAPEQLLLMLNDVQDNLLAEASEFVNSNTYPVTDYDAFKQAIERGGFVTAYWDGSTEDEEAIQDQTGATIRCIPLEQPGPGTCFYTGRDAERVALFARAY
jgi:prolyl-tRNA synthetase